MTVLSFLTFSSSSPIGAGKRPAGAGAAAIYVKDLAYLLVLLQESKRNGNVNCRWTKERVSDNRMLVCLFLGKTPSQTVLIETIPMNQKTKMLHC